MPEKVRAKMEGALGLDLSPVRIHERPHVEAVGALAYTQGTNIHFAPGQYRPWTRRGQELLGHELTHVVQQSQGRVPVTAQAKGITINDDATLEREADEMGVRAARGEGDRQPSRSLPFGGMRSFMAGAAAPATPAARAKAEPAPAPALGADFSDVRVHPGSARAVELGALAFTQGSDIHVAPGQWAPETTKGQELLGHELGHVLQQRAGRVKATAQLKGVGLNAELALEAEADAMGARAARGDAARERTPFARGHLGEVSEEGIIQKVESITNVDAKTYASINGVQISNDLNAKLEQLALPLNVDTAKWAGDGSKGIIQKGFHFDAGFADKLAPLIGGLGEVYRRIDKGRHLTPVADPSGGPAQPGQKGPMTYSPDVATELTNSIQTLIMESFARLLPRYLYARNQAMIAADEANKTRSPTAPEPAPADLTPSHPVDLKMREAMCSGVIDFDSEKYQAAPADETKVLAKTKRKLTVTIAETTEMSFWVIARPEDTKDTKPATVEEVAENLFGDPSNAYRLIAAPPRFGAKSGGNALTQTWKDALKARGVNQQFLDGWERMSEDPVANLLTDPKKADEVALQQAAGYTGPGGSKDDIVKRIGGNLSLVQSITAGAKKFGLDPQLGAIQAQLQQREQDLAKGDAGEAMKWDAHSAKQHDVLVSLDNSMAAVVGYFTSLADTAKDPTGQKLATEVRVLLRNACADVVTATTLVHLVEFASQRATAVGQMVTALSLDIMEALLRVVEQTIAEVAKHKGAGTYDTEGMKKREQELRVKISNARTEILKNPAMVQQLIEELFEQVGDMQTEAAMAANMDSLDEAIAKLSDKHWQDYYVPSTGSPFDFATQPDPMWMRMNDMKKRIQPFRDAWPPIYADWKSGDAKRKENAKTNFKAQIAKPEYIQALEDYQRLANEIEEWRSMVTIIATILAVIVITLASMGAGAALGGFASGVALGAGAAAGTAATIGAGVSLVTEAAVFTALNTIFLAEDKSWNSILFEFGFNLAMFGALRGLSKLYRSAKAVQAALKAGGIAKGIAVGGEMSAQFILLNVAAIAHEQIAHEVGLRKKELTKEEVKKIFAQSTGMFIAIAIAGRVAAPLFDKLAAVGGGLGARVTGMNAARAELFTAALAAKSNPSSDEIAKLIAKDKAELKNELEVFELIAKDIAAMEAAGIPHEEAVKIAADAGAAAYEGRVTAALQANATPISASMYRCTPAQKEAILEAYGKDAKVESVAKDGTAKTETFQVIPKQGRSIRLVVGEELPKGNTVDSPAAPKNETPTPDANTPPSLDGVPEGKQDIARWQTKGITTDAPDLWAKKASDGTAFKDTYQKWISQEHPYVEKDGKLEPVKPEGVSDAAWNEFKPTFESILKKGNITLTTKGAENVEALKAKGIDLTGLDPTSPDYAKVRPEIEKVLGKDALERWERSVTGKEGDPARAELDARLKKVLADEALAQLKSAFPDCEILLTGSVSQPGKPITAVKDVDVIIIAPDGAPPEWRVAAEKRAGEMKLPAGKELIEAGGPATLDVDAKVMTKEQYLGLRSIDPGKRTPMNDFRIDDHVKSAEDVAKNAGITDPAEVAHFKQLYGKHPGAAAALANACAKQPGLFGKLTAAWGDAALSKVTPTGGDRMNIHGELDISAGKLATLDETQLKDLLKVCEDPKTNEALAKKFEGGDTRFRFKSRVDARIEKWLDTVLTELGLDPKNPPDIFKPENLTPADRDGLWQIGGEGTRGDDPKTRAPAAKWALGRAKTARQFTADFQFFIGEVDMEVGRIASKIDKAAEVEIGKLEASQGGKKASPKQKDAIYKALTKKPVADGGLGEEFNNTTGKTVRNKMKELASATLAAGGADAAHTETGKQLSGDFAVGQTALSSPDPAAMGAEIKAHADTINFADVNEAAYHTKVHVNEISSADKVPGGNDVETYINSARETVRSGTMAMPVLSTDGKSYSFTFSRGDGVVIVKANVETGAASIATYMPSKNR